MSNATNVTNTTNSTTDQDSAIDLPVGKIFLLQNQDKLLLGKQQNWTDGRDLGALYKTRHKDEAVNQLFEVNSKDVTQRIHIIDCPMNKKGLPDIAAELLPPPLPKPPKAKSGEASEEETLTLEVDNADELGMDMGAAEESDSAAMGAEETDIEDSSEGKEFTGD